MRLFPSFSLPIAFAAIASLCSAADWQPLFNGKNLDGWTQLNGKAVYTIEGDAIVGTSVPKEPNSFLSTDRPYGDYIFEFEFKVDDGLNTGIQFRSLSLPEVNKGRVHGYQYEMDTSDRAWTAGIYDEARRGWLYPGSYNPDAAPLYRNNEWNQGRIECLGSEIRTYLNGKQVAHLIDAETATGFIALQVHGVGNNHDHVGKQVRWRKLRIQEGITSLPAVHGGPYIRNTLPNDLASAEAAQGWTQLFDGQKPIGLTSPGGHGFPADGWVVSDETLTILADPKDGPKIGGNIVTEKSFAAFELDFEFKLTPGANSGIKYFNSETTDRETGKKDFLGLEYQVLDDALHPDAKKGAVGNRTCASLYDLIPAYRKVFNRKVEVSVGGWNHGRIVALPDGTVQHWLNAFKVVEYQRHTNIFDALVARSKYASAEGFGQAKSGPILFQDHSDEVSYRSIKIRSLD